MTSTARTELELNAVRSMLSPEKSFGDIGDHRIGARTFTAILHREDDLYMAECPEVGTVSRAPR